MVYEQGNEEGATHQHRGYLGRVENSANINAVVCGTGSGPRRTSRHQQGGVAPRREK